jgi:transcriptional regulator with GAF, ATPase, and Fis domain
MKPLTSLDGVVSGGFTCDGPRDDGIVGHAPALQDALARVERVAPIDTTVLVTGETGTGKELIARELHRRSQRTSRPMVPVNLASIPEQLVASELFGHEPGAFTGAVQRRIGRFETADRSTLFLDEIGELSLEMQVALLRVVQDGEYSRLGACQARHVDVRLIVATNRSLDQAVEEGRFRVDLFYRLSVFPIHLPPLRERKDDIPLIADAFVRRLSVKRDRPFTGIEPSSMARLAAFSWPGNVRQLLNVLEQSFIMCDGPELHVPPMLLLEKAGTVHSGSSTLEAALRGTEQRLIEQALKAADGQVSGSTGAAVRLGVPASTLESKIRRFNIDKLRFRVCANRHI